MSAMIPLAIRTLFADLLQRSLDAEFDDEFSPAGGFQKRKRGNRYYWYYREGGREGQKSTPKYVGPVTDKSVTGRVQRFAVLKNDFRERQTTVRALISAGLTAPDPLTGALVEAMHQAGFFRLRGVLVGTVAFQTYAGLLGADFRGRTIQTQDADFAQFWGVAENIDDKMKPVLEVIQTVDESFAPVLSISDPFVSARYKNLAGYFVDMLTPNRGSDDHQGKIARMKALSGTGAQPLRHLDFLIHEPERSLLLYRGGIPVNVPRPERYAIHKLIVAVERGDQAKASKDIMQAETLIELLASQRPNELAEAFAIAWQEGRRWRDKIDYGMARLPARSQEMLKTLIQRWRSTRRGKREVWKDPPNWLRAT
jgi:hypothetical protein